MANTTPSPNMNLPVPTVGVDPGPDWATNVVASLEIIDSHNHSPGQGVQISPPGIDINADLPFNGNNATTLRSCNFTAQNSPLAGATDLGCIYVSGKDLYYNDEDGNQVRITTGGNVNAGAGSITGLPSGTASVSFSGGTYTFLSATNTPATMAVGPLVIGAASVSPKTVTIGPNGSQAANYSMTLPVALPAATSIQNITSSGQQAFVAPDGTTFGISSGFYGVLANGITDNEIADGAVTNAKLAALNKNSSNIAGNTFTTSSGSFVAISGMSISLTCLGTRPVNMMIIPHQLSSASSAIVTNGISAVVELTRNGNTIASATWNTGTDGEPFNLAAIDPTPDTGLNTYAARIKSNGGTVTVRNSDIYCWEM